MPLLGKIPTIEISEPDSPPRRTRPQMLSASTEARTDHARRSCSFSSSTDHRRGYSSDGGGEFGPDAEARNGSGGSGSSPRLGGGRTLTSRLSSSSSSFNPLSGSASASGPASEHYQVEDAPPAGSLGYFLTETSLGQSLTLAVVVGGLWGSGFALLLMNRFIFWTGLYKFPYPLTATWIQLVLSHVIFWFFACFTRILANPLTRIGLGIIVAPSSFAITSGGASSSPSSSSRSPPQPSNSLFCQAPNTLTHRFRSALLALLGRGKKSSARHDPSSRGTCCGGITGGGIVECRLSTLKHILPLSVIFIAQTVLSNVSFAFAVLPIFLLSRSGIVPLTFTSTHLFTAANYSVGALSSGLIATFTLVVALIGPVSRVTWESITAGMMSSLLAAVLPIFLVRSAGRLLHLVGSGSGTFRSVHSSDEDHELVAFDSSPPERPLLSTSSSFRGGGATCGDETYVTHPSDRNSLPRRRPSPEAKVFWVLLHYISLTSIVILTPFLFISDEVSQIRRNCYFLDVPWFWFLCFMAGLAFACQCIFYLLLVRLSYSSGMKTGSGGGGSRGGDGGKDVTWGNVSAGVSTSMVFLAVAAVQLATLGGKRSPQGWLGVLFCLASCLWYSLSD